MDSRAKSGRERVKKLFFLLIVILAKNFQTQKDVKLSDHKTWTKYFKNGVISSHSLSEGKTQTTM